jgi:hypothetical protein
MKRSARVRLVLLGSAVGLYACDNGSHDLFRQRYNSLEECRRDWKDPDDCKPVGGAGASGGSGSWGGSGGTGVSGNGGYYYGPRYYWDPRSGGPVEVRPDGSTRSLGNAHSSGEGVHFGGVRMGAGFVSRGGFGSSARAFGSGRG